MFYRWLLSAFLGVSGVVQAATTLKGDKNASEGETFSFEVQDAFLSTAPDLAGTFLYVAADPSAGGSGNVNDFAVSRVSRDTTSFFPLTPEKVALNFQKDVQNPLYDKGIAFFSVLNAAGNILAGAPERPVIVLNDDKKSIYLINNFSATGQNITILSVHKGDVPSQSIIVKENVPDSTAALTSGIVQIAAADPFIFAVVGPNTGSFGDPGTGIALAVLGSVAINNDIQFSGPIIIDAPTGVPLFESGNRALPLNVSTTALKIGSNLASIGTVVDMVWHKSIGRLYIALQTTGGAAGTDGARSIVTARVTDENKLVLEPIAPGDAITGTDKIIGAVGSSSAVTAHKVRELFTSTALPYLVVLGNVGAPSATLKTVFALPLVSGNSAELNGSIASKNASPEDLFVENTDLFAGRVIKQEATTASQMPLATDAATQVGGGALLNGDITDIFVYQDTVFAAVTSAGTGQLPGIFYSQALFEQNGKIKGWTIWQRAVGLTDKDHAIFLDNITGKFYTLVADNALAVKTVKRTEWENGDAKSIAPLVEAIDDFFPQEQAGVQGVHDFVVTSTALDTATPGLLDISLLVATGNQRVLLAQTSRVVTGAVLPIRGSEFGTPLSFEDGTITETFPTMGSRVIGIEGGALTDMGPIVAAEVAQDGSGGANGWLFVGGTGGVAVLSKADGSGWATASGLSDGLAGLESGMSFKAVGDFSFVRKLIYDDGFLYVVTNTEIVRIDLTVGSPGLGSISATTIATVNFFPQLTSSSTFLDAVVSEKLIMVGTNAGLFRLANGLDARTIDTQSAAWESVPTPEGAGPVRQLFAISQTGRAQDIGRRSEGGMLYTLSAFRGNNQAQLHRFDIAQVTSGSLSNATVRKIQDLFIENIPSYFASFGMFRNIFATDGSLFYGTQSDTQGNSSQATVLNSKKGIRTGSRFLNSLVIPAGLTGSTLISAMILNGATGTWLIGGDHGVRANE